jgi:hypothetical protein
MERTLRIRVAQIRAAENAQRAAAAGDVPAAAADAHVAADQARDPESGA